MRRALFTSLIASLVAGGQLLAQEGTGRITGVVTAAEGIRPVIGATVVVQGTGLGTTTRDDGSFQISGVPAGPRTVQVRQLGYGPQTQSVSVPAGGTATVNFTLQRQAVALEGVVTIGYGEQQADRLAGSVAAVTPEDFNTGRVVSAEELIASKVPGVQIANTGEPGGATNIRIRGGTSVNASNEPLFVVDGVPLPVGGGLSSGRNPLNFLNPDDIASVTVLKDASATAIYGSRGANGVIIIETKSGVTTGPQISYTGSVSTSDIVDRSDILSAQQFRAAVAEYAPEREQYLGAATTDWRDAVLRNAVGQEHNVAIAGSGEAMNYRLSVGYLDQAGVVLGSNTERVSAALNYNHDLFGDRVAIEATLRGVRTEDQYTPGGGLGAATIFDPTQAIRDGSDFFEQREFDLSPTNPVAELAAATVAGKTFRGIGNLQARYRMPFLDALTATGRVGFDVASSERQEFFPSLLYGQSRAANPGYLSRSNPRETTALVDLFANYAAPVEVLQGEVDATVGYSYEGTRGDYPFFELRGLSTDLLGPNGVPEAVENLPRLSVREGRLASFFGRVNYTLRDKYIFMASVRRDGSSRFGPGNQWGTFPAAAVAWRVADEAFLGDFDALSDLKLRASWGINGNQTVADYLWIANYAYGDAFSRVQFGDEFLTTIRPTAVDPNIKWEETTSWNVGLDYGFLDNRITGTLDYYVKDTDDLLFRVPVAAGTAVSNSITTNVGSVRNSGVEFGIDAEVLPREGDGLRWDVNFNAAYNTNELTRINPFGGGERILVGGISGGIGSNIQVLQPGSPVNSFFVYQHRRDANGRPISAENDIDMYVDQNADGVINQNDRVATESPAPDWILGHTSSLGYGAFDLSFTLSAQLGNHVYNNLASSQGYYGRLNEAAGPVNLHASVLENGFERAQFFSDIYVEDASFVRMDNITLGWNVPRTRGLQQMRVFGTIQNAFTFTDYSGVDPVVGLTGIDNNVYPRSRTYTAGVTVGF